MLEEKEKKDFFTYQDNSLIRIFQNNINWERVSRTESSHVVKDLVQEYMFAVSMETPEASSGFKWQSCYYIREKSEFKSNQICKKKDLICEFVRHFKLHMIST